jgi:hypothetical protein
MYVHPQETDYNINTLFALIEASGLEFIGFSNPLYWQLDRLLGKAPELVARAKNLTQKDQYRLIELLDPTLTHYEFFLGKAPLKLINWSLDERLLSAIPEVQPCLHGWPSKDLFNYDYQPVKLSDLEFEFMQASNGLLTVREILEKLDISLDKVRELQVKQLIILGQVAPKHD